MPNCPKCGNRELTPVRTFSVIVEPSRGERGMVERKVGMYTCAKCGTKFPTVISRQRYLIVAEEQLRSLQTELGALKEDNKDMQAKVQNMVEEQRKLQEALERVAKDSELRQLELKLGELESYVEHLRKEKGELEQKATKLS